MQRRALLAGLVSGGMTMLPIAAWADGLIFRRGGSAAGAPVNGTIAVTEIASDRIFQRVGTAKAIVFSGTYTGNPDAIQVQIVDATSGTTIQDWTTLSSPTISGGNWSGTLSVNEGAWYKFKARFAGNTSVTANASNKFGVGMLVACLGQSNMQHMWSGRSFPPAGDAKTRRYLADAWRAVDAVVTGSEVSALSGGAAGGNGSVQLANSLRTLLTAAGHDIPVGLLEYAISGTTSTTWLSGNSSWTNFVSSSTGVNAPAVGGDFEQVVWYQGESDSGLGVTGATHKTNLGTILTQLQTQTGRDASSMKMGIVTLGSAGGTSWGTDTSWNSIRSADLQFIAANAANGVYYAASAVEGLHTTGDNVHLAVSAYVRMARRYAQSVAKSLGYASVGGEGPVLTSATFSNGSADVTVNITQAGGAALLDGAGSSAGTGLLGFSVKVNGTPATISSTAISGNTVILTLSAPLATGNTVTVQYAGGLNPFAWVFDGSDTVDHVLYDDQSTLLGDTVGLPLRPTDGAITASLV